MKNMTDEKHVIRHKECGEPLLRLYVEGIECPITDVMYCGEHGIAENHEWEIDPQIGHDIIKCTPLAGKVSVVKMFYDILKNEDGYAFQDEIVEESMKYKVFKNKRQVEFILDQLRLEGKIVEKNNMIKITSLGKGYDIGRFF